MSITLWPCRRKARVLGRMKKRSTTSNAKRQSKASSAVAMASASPGKRLTFCTSPRMEEATIKGLQRRENQRATKPESGSSRTLQTRCLHLLGSVLLKKSNSQFASPMVLLLAELAMLGRRILLLDVSTPARPVLCFLKSPNVSDAKWTSPTLEGVVAVPPWPCPATGLGGPKRCCGTSAARFSKVRVRLSRLLPTCSATRSSFCSISEKRFSSLLSSQAMRAPTSASATTCS
mmetsp:Transcript_62677/g.140986  ORF Transcript_62677/g.140986 Transcript_62677/m.140986 type:complete len:233 (+) Transcript_62677:1137-1835(+)